MKEKFPKMAKKITQCLGPTMAASKALTEMTRIDKIGMTMDILMGILSLYLSPPSLSLSLSLSLSSSSSSSSLTEFLRILGWRETVQNLLINFVVEEKSEIIIT
jgi:hypothetical protein